MSEENNEIDKVESTIEEEKNVEETTLNLNENISNTIEQKETMEVHHHPDIHHNPKKWKEYFIEFLMIFLAVTLGFFAENLREHFVENERAKQYAQSLYDDLKTDTLTLQRTYNEKDWIQKKYDSAKNILSSNQILENNEFLYFIERYLRTNDVFTPQDITYQQLRSSGNFRYFKKAKLYKDVCDYYNLYTRYQTIDGSFGTTDESELLNIETNIFNLKELTNLNSPTPSTFYNLVLRPENKFTPIKADIHFLNIFYVKFDNARYQANSAKIFLGWLKLRAINLLIELKSEYDLK